MHHHSGSEHADDGEEHAEERNREKQRRVADVRDAAGCTVILFRIGVVLDVERLRVDRGGFGKGKVAH